MITNLHIKNIGIIDDLEINLKNGMNVLTGETGAGKTLIIDSLEIISGGRFSKEMIRHEIYAPKNGVLIEGVKNSINLSQRTSYFLYTLFIFLSTSVSIYSSI